MNRLLAAPLFLLLAADLSAAPATFFMKNNDPEALFCWWAAAPSSRTTAAVLGNLPLAPGGRHLVAPGERVRIQLPEGYGLVAVFLPWREPLSLTTRLSGGSVLPSEVPGRGTLLIDRPSFLASNRGRILEGTLAEWGLEVPAMVLDGQFGDWSDLPVLVEWGKSFSPSGPVWPASWPRPRTLQAVLREGALWLRFVWEAGRFPAGVEVSLLLSRPGAVFEWPLTGPSVWTWDDASVPQTAGSQVAGPGTLEAWIPWDRLAEPVQRAWTREPGEWTLAASAPGEAAGSYRLGDFRWEDLP